MTLDINLAVGDGARRMTYAEGEGPGTEPTPDEERPRPAEADPKKVRGSDPLTAIAMQTLSQAVEMLRQDVKRERGRADRAEQQVEEGRKRNDELQATLLEERRRIDGLYAELARTAAMISGCEAAVLRTRLELLAERRPWWRRWFPSAAPSGGSRIGAPDPQTLIDGKEAA